MQRRSLSACIVIKFLSQSVLTVFFTASVRGLCDSIRKQEQLVSRIDLHRHIRILRIGEYSQNDSAVTEDLHITSGAM